MSNVSQETKDAFFREIDRFIQAHLRFKYPLSYRYAISKHTIKSLREIGGKLKKHPAFVGISVYGSRARGYASTFEEDFDLIVLLDSRKFSKNASESEKIGGIRGMADELAMELKRKSLYPCEAGIDYFDLAKAELTPVQRMELKLVHERVYREHNVNADTLQDPFWLFHGLPVVGTKEIITARRKYLARVVRGAVFREEWGRTVKKLQARYDFGLKATVRILGSVLPGVPCRIEDPSWVLDQPSEVKELVEDGRRRIDEALKKKNQKAGFHADPVIELRCTTEWLKERMRRQRRKR